MSLRSVAALSVALSALALSACGQGADPAPEAASPDVAAPASASGSAPTSPMAEVFNEKAVWNGALDACRAEGAAPSDQCLISAIQSGGGSPEAVAVARVLSASGNPGYVSAWRQEGRVGVATVTYPFRANTNQETRLVPAIGTPINVENLSAFERDAAWTTFMQAHSDAFPVPPAELVTTTTDQSGQSFVFSTPLRTCRACETVGTATVTYDFDAQGALSAQSLLSVK